MSGRQDSPQSMIIVLAVICAGAGLALGATFLATTKNIEAQQLQEQMKARRAVLPDAHPDGFRAVDVDRCAFAVKGTYYEAYDKPLKADSRRLVGYALEAQGNGYSSAISVTIGVNPKGEVIRGVKITSQRETPGLGTKCEEVKVEGTLWEALFGKAKQSGESEPWFQAQFRGKRSDSLMKVGSKYRDIDGLTGATITTNAVADAVVAAVKEFKQKVLNVPAGGK